MNKKSKIKTKKRKLTNKKKEKTKKQFLYNPNNPKKSFDVYIDKNPSDTIHIKYKTVEDLERTIRKLERLLNLKSILIKRIYRWE